MILTEFFRDKNVIVAQYLDGVSEQDVEDYEKFIHYTFSQVAYGEKVTTITDCSEGKITSGVLASRLGKLTDQYKYQTDKIYITGMSPFIRILYKSYLKFSGNDDIHEVTKDPLSNLCHKFSIPMPERTELH